MATGTTAEVVPLSLARWKDKPVIFLETVAAELADPSLETFEMLQNMLLYSKGVLWVTRGASIDCEKPLLALSHGLLRTLRCENTSIRYLSLDLDPSRSLWSAEDIHSITRIYKTCFNFGSEQSIFDFEYAERKGTILVPRVVQSLDKPTTSAPEEEFFQDSYKELYLDTETRFSNGAVFRSLPVRDEQFPDTWVQIIPHAFSVDHLTSPTDDDHENFNLSGYGTVGQVVRVGVAVNNVKIGQRVCALASGTYSSCIRVPSTQVIECPGQIEVGAAVRIPTVLATAYIALHEVACLQRDETVLIHAATLPIGRAAIFLARSLGARVIVTASTSQKRQTLIEEMEIDKNCVLSSRDPLFSTLVMSLTKGNGVDVVFNPLSGEVTAESWKCIAAMGRFCQIGRQDIVSNKAMDIGPFARMASFTVVDPITFAEYRARDFQRVLSACVRLLFISEGFTLGSVMKIPISQIEDVPGVLQVAYYGGKGNVVITVNKKDKVKVRNSITIR